MAGGAAAAALAAPLASAESFTSSQPDAQVTVTVTGSAVPGHNSTYQLSCDPPGGSHPDAAEACQRLGQLAERGEDPFEPVAANAMCTQIYGGPAEAHVTGTWRGENVRASFSRSDGCEIARWDKLTPLLPIEHA